MDSLQGCVKYAESESSPCQHSGEVFPITERWRTFQMAICVHICEHVFIDVGESGHLFLSSGAYSDKLPRYYQWTLHHCV